MESVNTSVLVAQIGLLQGLAVVIISGIFALVSKFQEKKAKELREEDMAYRAEREERDRRREERDSLVYDLVFATATGTEVLLHAAHGDHVNGNVDEALASLKKAKGECNHVFNKNNARL